MSKNKKLTKKDVSIVIATYNRSKELNRTLHMLKENDNIPGKIFVIDQSKDDYTKIVCLKYSKTLPVIYKHSDIPSSSISKNIGIKNSKKFKLILVLDDDVDLLKGYIDEALKEFNSNKDLMGLGGIDISSADKDDLSWPAKLWFKIFFLSHRKDKLEIIGPYGVVGTLIVKEPVRDAQWLPGFNEFFRQEIFSNYKMPESIGYNVLEDIDSSYYTFKKYGLGSLMITPKCRTVHRFSQTTRYAEKKRIFVNHEDHFYFYYAYFHPKAKFKLAWSIFGILLGLFGKYIFTLKRNNFFALKYNLEAIRYCLKNRESIRKGKLRSFLNPDTSMKKKFI